MSLATNKALIRRWIETGLNTGDWDVIGDCFSPAYASSDMRGTADLERSLATIRTAFPDLRVRSRS